MLILKQNIPSLESLINAALPDRKMDGFSLSLLIVGLIAGFLIGKYLYDKAKWADKKKIVESEWRLKLEALDKKYQYHLQETQNKNEIAVRKITHEWELKYTNDLAEIKQLIQSAEKYMRYDAVKRSKRTLLGKLWEQVSPYLPKFPFRPSDMKFIGAPIDFIIFDGASENDIRQVIFLEVKSGDSKLSSQEKKLKQAIEEGKVSWRLFNVDKPEEVRIQEEGEDAAIEGEVTPHELYRTIDTKISRVKKDDPEEGP